jgi:hypothetical protein
MRVRRIWKGSTIIYVVTAVLLFAYARPIAFLLHTKAVLLFAYARPIALLLYTKWEVRKATELWVVPTPLRLVATEPQTGKTLSYFGYDFESPWTDVKRERKLESIAVVNFSGGQFISILDPAHSTDELQMMKREATKRGVELRSVLGEEATRSRYALRSKILNLTPGDLRLFSPRQEMVANSVFLIMKKAWMARLKGGLYSFETNWLRGFQEGGPAQDDMVIIEAFDAQDHEIQVWIGSGHGASNRPSQADINRILYSLRPAPTSQAK